MKMIVKEILAPMMRKRRMIATFLEMMTKDHLKMMMLVMRKSMLTRMMILIRSRLTRMETIRMKISHPCRK